MMAKLIHLFLTVNVSTILGQLTLLLTGKNLVIKQTFQHWYLHIRTLIIN